MHLQFLKVIAETVELSVFSLRDSLEVNCHDAASKSLEKSCPCCCGKMHSNKIPNFEERREFEDSMQF